MKFGGENNKWQGMIEDPSVNIEDFDIELTFEQKNNIKIDRVLDHKIKASFQELTMVFDSTTKFDGNLFDTRLRNLIDAEDIPNNQNPVKKKTPSILRGASFRFVIATALIVFISIPVYYLLDHPVDDGWAGATEELVDSNVYARGEKNIDNAKWDKGQPSKELVSSSVPSEYVDSDPPQGVPATPDDARNLVSKRDFDFTKRSEKQKTSGDSLVETNLWKIVNTSNEPELQKIALKKLEKHYVKVKNRQKQRLVRKKLQSFP